MRMNGLRQRKWWYFFVLFVAALVGACASASQDEIAGVAESELRELPSSSCDIFSDEGEAAGEFELCRLSLSSGVTAVALVPDGQPTESAVVVDVGGPETSTDLVVQGLVLASGELEGMTLVGVAVPSPELEPACFGASAETLVDACDLEAIQSSYVDQYISGVKAALAEYAPDAATVDVVGTSYASARWAQIVVGEEPLQIRHVSIAQPLSAGVTGARLDGEAGRVANELYAAVLSDGCLTAACLAPLFQPGEPPCDGVQCDAVALLAEAAGVQEAEVLEGLKGLAPLITENGASLREAFVGQDQEALVEILRQGRFAYAGRDPLGGLQASEVMLLAGVCPILAVEDLSDRYQLCENVPRSPLVSGSAGDVLADSGRAPQSTCLTATYPDPVLGRSSSYGLLFGQQSHRELVEGRFGHGDIAYAAQILGATTQRIGQPEKFVCPVL